MRLPTHSVWQCSVICCKSPPVVNRINTKAKADAGLQIQGGGLPQLSCNAKGQQQLSPALTLRPEAETVDRALAKEISRDLSLMMLAASIANTAIASLHAQQVRAGQGKTACRPKFMGTIAQHSR